MTGPCRKSHKNEYRRIVRHCAALMAFILLSGYTGVAQAQDPAPKQAGVETAEGMRVLVTASEEATISGQIDARILSAGPGDGESFAKGAVLVKFDCSLMNAALKEARAELKGASANLATKTKLDRLGSISGLELELARSAVDKSAAAVSAARWRVRNCTISAPFDGRVVKRLANAHEIVSPGQELMTIVSSRDPEVRVIVPSRWSSRISAGDVFGFNLEETGKSYQARVISLGSKIDPASQSIEIRAKVLNPPPEIIIGMSGIAQLRLD